MITDFKHLGVAAQIGQYVAALRAVVAVDAGPFLGHRIGGSGQVRKLQEMIAQHTLLPERLAPRDLLFRDRILPDQHRQRPALVVTQVRERAHRRFRDAQGNGVVEIIDAARVLARHVMKVARRRFHTLRERPVPVARNAVAGGAVGLKQGLHTAHVRRFFRTHDDRVIRYQGLLERLRQAADHVAGLALTDTALNFSAIFQHGCLAFVRRQFVQQIHDLARKLLHFGILNGIDDLAVSNRRRIIDTDVIQHLQQALGGIGFHRLRQQRRQQHQQGGQQRHPARRRDLEHNTNTK